MLKQVTTTMKLLLLTFVAAIISSSQADSMDDLRTKIKGIAGDCAKETGASDNDLSDFLGQGMDLPKSHEAQCLTLCVAKRTGFYDDGGNYSESGAKAFLEPLKDGHADLYDKFLGIGLKCSQEVGPPGTDCTKAALLHQCCLKAQSEMM